MIPLRHNLDHAAGGPPRPEIAALYPELAARYGANPHGITCYAEECRRALIAAEEELLAALQIRPAEAFVLWCATGTEALNLALHGAYNANRCTSVIYDKSAHPALAQTAQVLPDAIPFTLDGSGHALLPANPPPGPHIVALPLVNNENGARWDGDRNALPPDTLLVADGCQALGKEEIPWEEAHIDLLAVSGRKIGGPAAAALVCRRGIPLKPLLTGGGQQQGLRAGTVDVAAALMLARAATMAVREQTAAQERAAALKAQLLKGLRPEWPLFSPEGASPFITLFALPDYDGAVVARILAQEHGILVGTGSACAAEHGDPSPTLAALRVPEATARGALRVSFGAQSAPEDVAAFLSALPQVLASW